MAFILYALFYVFSLSSALMALALAAKLTGRSPKRWKQLLPCLTVFACIFGASVLFTGIARDLLESKISPGWLLLYVLSWTIVFSITGVSLMIRLLKRDPSGLPLARGIRGGALFVMIALSVGVTAGSYVFMDKRVSSYIDGLAGESEAIVAKFDYIAPSPEDNAATVYNAAFAEASSVSVPAWMGRINEPGFDPSSEEVAQFLYQHSGIVNSVADGSRKPLFYIPLDFRGMNSPELSNVLMIGRIMSVEARALADKGKYAEAMELLGAELRFARHLSGVPSYIPVLQSGIIYEQALGAFAYIIKKPGFPRHGVSFPSFQPSPYPGAYVRAIRSEQALMLGIISEASSLKKFIDVFAMTSDSANSRLWVIPYRVFLMRQDIEYARGFYAMAEGMFSMNYVDAKKRLSDWEKDFDSSTRGGFLTANLLPSYEKLFTHASRAQAVAAVSDAAIAALRFRDRHNRLPAKPEELAPGFLKAYPADPFDSRPLRFVEDEGFLLIYSIGENLKDDMADGDDIAVRLEVK